MKLTSRGRHSGFTVLEMTVSVACGLMVLAAVLTAGVALQRSFMAVEGYSMAEGDQLRVQDYIAMDCRRAVTGTISGYTGNTPAVSNGSWSNGTWVPDPTKPITLLLTVPAYYDNSGAPLAPIYDSSTGVIQYNNGATITISYYQSGTNFIRNVNGVETAIATNVDSFTVTPQDLTSSVTCSITFAPRFVYLPGPGPVNGTTVFSNTFLRNAVARQ